MPLFKFTIKKQNIRYNSDRSYSVYFLTAKVKPTQKLNFCGFCRQYLYPTHNLCVRFISRYPRGNVLQF